MAQKRTVERDRVAQIGGYVHPEPHRTGRAGWLRAAVLGANDGLTSVSSLVIGVAAAQTAREAVLIAGIAGVISGALSMAAGEYVSVSSQSDVERADLEQERRALAAAPEVELNELTAIYVSRGLSPELARTVAQQLSAHNALEAHARDEIGITEALRARPLQAAIASAVAFTAGAAPPVLLAWLGRSDTLVPTIALATLVLLGVLGGIGAVLGGAPWLKASARVMFWGAAAMLLTGVIGRLVGTAAL